LKVFHQFSIHCNCQFHGTRNRPLKHFLDFLVSHCLFIPWQYSICRNLSLQMDTYK
jgi:hypothetical protein